MNKKVYNLNDFKDFLNSTDHSNVIIGLYMTSSLIPIKSMNLIEIMDFNKSFRELRCYGSYSNRVIIDLKGKIYNKINNRIQKLQNYERNRT